MTGVCDPCHCWNVFPPEYSAPGPTPVAGSYCDMMRATVIADEEHLMQLNRQASKGLWIAAVAGVIAVIGCIDHSVTGPNHQNTAGLAVRLLLQDGNGQTGAVGANLSTPISVKVLDANGLGVQGATVTFGVRKGNGTLGSPTAVSDTNGVARSTWKMGTVPGAGSVTAILSTANVIDSVVVAATAVAGTAATAVITTGDQQLGVVGQMLPVNLTATTYDAYGNISPNSPVAWSVVSGGGKITALNATSDANGVSAAQWTLGTVAGTQAARAGVGTAINADFHANANGGNPTAMLVDAGAAQSGMVGRTLTVPLSVRVTDAFGNGVRGANIVWSADDGSIVPIGSGTDSTGRMGARWTLGTKTGPQSALASLNGSTPVPFAAVATAAAVNAAAIETGNAQTQSINNTLPLPLVVRVSDSFGNPVAGVPVNWSTAGASGSIVVANNTTDATGRSTALWTLGVTAGPMTALANISGQPILQFNATATTVAGVPDTLKIVAGNNQTGNAVAVLPVPLIVKLVDTHGVPVKNANIVFAVATGGGSMASAVVTTDSTGVAQTTWTLGSLYGVQTASATYGTKTVLFSATARQQYKVRLVSSKRNLLSAPCTNVFGGTGCPANAQTDTTGATLGDTLIVQVYDPNDTSVPFRGVQGISITWATQAGDATDGAPVNSTVTTDSAGYAWNIWVLRSNGGVAIAPNAVAKRMIATVAQIGQVEFQAKVYPGRAVVLSMVTAPSALVDTMSNTVVVKLTDANNYGVGGATVVANISALGSLAKPSFTAADGSMTFGWAFKPGCAAQSLSVTTTTTQTLPYGVGTGNGGISAGFGYGVLKTLAGASTCP